MNLTLSRYEAIYIDDQITSERFGPPQGVRSLNSTALIAVPESLIIKMASVVWEFLSNTDLDHLSVYFEEAELLLLRELALSSVLFGNNKVGLSLKKKIYRRLLFDEANDNTEYAPTKEVVKKLIEDMDKVNE